MPTVLLNEYQNQHEHRNYPFTDAATMTADTGLELPTDVFVDIFVTPIDITGAVFMSSLDLAQGTMEFSDAETLDTVGTVTWSAGDADAIIYDTSGFEREIGRVVFGSGVEEFTADGALTFGPSDAPLLPACFIAMNQPGVRGIIDDNSQLSAGRIKFVGRNGVNVKTYVDSAGRSILRIDIVGEPPPAIDDCRDNDEYPIEQIKIENRDCTPIVGTHDGYGTLIVSGPGFGLDSQCTPKSIPEGGGTIRTDVCDTPPEPPPEWPCPPDSDDVVPVIDGHIGIAAPSTIAIDNPLRVITEVVEGESIDLTRLNGLTDIAAIERRMRQLMRWGVKPGGRITLALKGSSND